MQGGEPSILQEQAICADWIFAQLACSIRNCHIRTPHELINPLSTHPQVAGRRHPGLCLASQSPPKSTKTIECLGRCNHGQYRRRGPVKLARRHTHFLSLPSGAMLLARQSLRRQGRSSPTRGGKWWSLPCDGAGSGCGE